MRKIVFVDGSQGVGKSTLISGLSTLTPTYVYKFPFSDYSKAFNLKSKESLKGFQLGKDLATLYFMGKAYTVQPYPQVVDRGPLSTAYYSLTTGRMTEAEVEEFFKIMSEMVEHFSFVFIKPKNQTNFIRDKKDGFDRLKALEVDPDKAIETIVLLAKKYRIPLKVFENDFSVDIKKNVNNFYKLVKEEL